MTQTSRRRTVSWFSCGAASAVATKIACDEFYSYGPISIACIEINQEHPDNQRFIADCEKWFDRQIVRLGRPDYQSDTDVVFRRSRFLVGPDGASCTRILKREVRARYELPTDRHVFGFTYEEQDRYDRFLDANNIDCDAPLIRHKLTKKDCLGMLHASGIEIPMMYRMGYKNNNCIGCVKGGAGYWNKIRVDFPERFEQMARIEEELGRAVIRVVDRYEVVNGKKKRIMKNLPLRQLDPNQGRYETEEDIECGAVCQMAADRFAEACDDL